jgi:type IV secretory pathway VirB9-like protein
MKYSVYLSIGFTLLGCATPPQHRPVPQAVATPTPITAPTPIPAPVDWQPAYQPSPPQVRRNYPRVEPMAAGGKTITFRPGQKVHLYCAETGTLTIKFPAGETIVDYGVGASGEWIVDKRNMGIDLPIGAIVVGRTPFARTAEMHVITDAEVYQFILSPSANGISQKQATLIQVVNPETEARRAEREHRRMEVAEVEQREREPQVPRLNPDYLRVYRVGGDNVPWKPVSVVGDNQQTIIQLPAGGVTQPTLTAIEDGKEVRIYTRTVLKADGKGPRIVADQPFTEARLIGEGGTVSIIGAR